MDVVAIFNGLGNQMSQYAFYLQKKKIDRTTRFIEFGNTHNGPELARVFNITLQETFFDKALYLPFRILLNDRIKAIQPVKRFLGLFNFKIVKENYNYNFNSRHLLPSKGIIFYFGGWPSEQYFTGAKDEVLTAFRFKTPDDSENCQLIADITASNSVSIHVRRGDYLDASNIDIYGGVCTKEYFEKAIALFGEKIANPHFYVFSNDIPWVKANLRMDNVTFVTCNKGKNSWKDMYLMSICKHNIIANSTFSWWGAWLNANAGKIVISPSRYMNNDTTTDVYPLSWIRLSDY